MPADSRLHLRLPLRVVLTDAALLIAFVEKYWRAKPSPSGRHRPGLETVADASFSPAIAKEMGALIEAVELAQNTIAQARAEPAGASRELVQRGRFVLRELIATLAWRCTRAAATKREAAQLERLRRAHASTRANSALALALEDFSTIAARYRKELEGLGGFDDALIDEAPVLAEKIRGLSAARMQVSRAKAARLERDHALGQLLEHMARVRDAARFVFRHHPAIARQATSPYARRQRARQYKREKMARGSQIADALG